MSASFFTYEDTRCFGVRPAAICICLHWVSNWHFCSQSRNVSLWSTRPFARQRRRKSLPYSSPLSKVWIWGWSDVGRDAPSSSTPTRRTWQPKRTEQEKPPPPTPHPHPTLRPDPQRPWAGFSSTLPGKTTTTQGFRPLHHAKVPAHWRGSSNSTFFTVLAKWY